MRGAVAGNVRTGDVGIVLDNITVSGHIELSGSGAGLIGSMYYGASYDEQNASKIIISNCTNNADVVCKHSAAGIVESISCGDVDLEITDCINNGNISTRENEGANIAAGIVSRISAKKATIDGCSNAGEIISGIAAGLFGTLERGSLETRTYQISSCNNTGNIIGTNSVAGITYSGGNSYVDCSNSGTLTLSKDGDWHYTVAGVVGYMYGSGLIENCANTGAIIAEAPCQNICGIVGSFGNVYGGNYSSNTLKNCLNTANIVGRVKYAAGIACMVGSSELEISGCINKGRVKLEEDNSNADAAGIVSSLRLYDGDKLIKDNINKGDISGVSSAGIIGGVYNNYSNEYEHLIIQGCENYGKIENGAGIVGGAERTIIELSSNYGDISGSGVAGIIANGYTGVKLKKCRNYGNIANTNSDYSFMTDCKTAGICIEAEKVEECINYGKVVSVGKASGIVILTDEVIRCINNGDISGRCQTAGIVGEAYTVKECINHGDVITNVLGPIDEEEIWNYKMDYVTAGIIAIGTRSFSCEGDSSDFIISNCYNTGNVRTEISQIGLSGYRIIAGGIVGEHQGYGELPLAQSCYNIGNVYSGPNTSGRVLAAGIVGLAEGLHVNSCISVAPKIIAERDIEIWGDEDNYEISEAIGIGLNNNADNNLYRNDVVFGDSSPRSTAIEPVKFEDQTTYTEIGWDFDNVWKMPTNEHALPVLRWSGYDEGTDIDYSSYNKLTLSEVMEYTSPDNTFTITPKVKYDGVIVENPEVTWSSTNTDVATVENGVVTTHGIGDATIIARYRNLKATCSVYVSRVNERDEGWSEKRISLRFGAKKGNVLLPVNWGWETLANGDCYTYDENLAVIGLILSRAVETSKTIGVNRMQDLGFENVKAYNYDDNFISQPGVVIGSTSYGSGENRKYFFGVSIRGTSSFWDAITDAKSVGDGFLGAGESTIEAFKEHVREYYGINNLLELDPDNVYMFVTGHSLGGASAQQFARMITPYTYRDQTYVYTFASPNINCQADAPESYKNVFNIVNVADKVPAVPFGPYFHEWGSYWLRKIGNTRSFNYKQAMIDEFDKYSNIDLKTYTIFHQYELPDHDCSTYMAQITSNASYLSGSPSYIRYSIWCPVDVEVYDKSGNLLGRIVDNIIDPQIQELIPMFIDGDHKEIVAPEDLELDIRITATDNGTMEYFVNSYENGTDNMIAKAKFENVQLTTGKTMLATTQGDGAEIKLFVTDDDGKKVKEIQEDGTEVETVSDNTDDENKPDDSNDEKKSDNTEDENIPEGLRIVGVDDSYVYAGTAIKPEPGVYDGKKRLVKGLDYTVSYKNNVNASNVSSTALPTITVTGKGTYAGKKLTKQFSISKADISKLIYTSSVPVLKGKKASFAIYNNGNKISNSNLLLSPEAKSKWENSGTFTVSGRGRNYEGTVTISAKVIDTVSKMKVQFGTDKLYYDGNAKVPSVVKVVDRISESTLTEGVDYIVSTSDDVVNVGKHKITIVGVGKYTGAVGKTYSILKPIDAKFLVNIKTEGGVALNKKGTIIPSEKIEVLAKLSPNGEKKKLLQGRDFTISYSKNKAVGTAKYTIKGLGNYNGIVIQKGEFVVVK